MDDFHYAHVLIVEEDEDPAPVLLKAETDRPLVDSVYLQCETVVPFTHIRVHVFNPADGSSHFLPRIGAEEESSAVLARALGKDSDLMVWVLADRRPDAVEAVGEDGLDKIDADALPCDSQHASTLCQAARLMCSGMHTPAGEVHSQMNDHLNDGLQKDGFSLSEVTSRVVPHSGGTATAATVRLERLDEDEHTGRVSFVVTTCTPGKDGEAQVLERSVRVHTPLPARPKRRVKPVHRYSPSGSAMTPQTLTSISEARLEQSTSLLSADVSARSADDSFDTPRSDVTEATDSGPSSGSPEDGEEPSAHMTDSSVGSVADDTATTIYGQLAHSPAAHGLEEQSHDDSQRLQYLPHEAKVAIELALGDMDAEELSGLPERMAAPLDMPLGVLLSSALLRTVEIQSANEPPLSEGGEGARTPRLAGNHLDSFVMDVLVKGEWQELPLGTTIGSVGGMNTPSPNRLRVRVAKCEDSRRLERQAQEMQLLRERALPAHKLTDSPVPLRKVLVVVPIRVNHDNRYCALLNVMRPATRT